MNKMKKYYKVHGGVTLKGEVQISGAKNAATKEIVASLLSAGKCTLKNVPKIGDVLTTIKICESVGVDPEDMTRLGLEKAEERFLRLDYKHFDLGEIR